MYIYSYIDSYYFYNHLNKSSITMKYVCYQYVAKIAFESPIYSFFDEVHSLGAKETLQEEAFFYILKVRGRNEQKNARDVLVRQVSKMRGSALLLTCG